MVNTCNALMQATDNLSVKSVPTCLPVNPATTSVVLRVLVSASSAVEPTPGTQRPSLSCGLQHSTTTWEQLPRPGSTIANGQQQRRAREVLVAPALLLMYAKRRETPIAYVAASSGGVDSLARGASSSSSSATGLTQVPHTERHKTGAYFSGTRTSNSRPVRCMRSP